MVHEGGVGGGRFLSVPTDEANTMRYLLCLVIDYGVVNPEDAIGRIGDTPFF
jgi:hypothetical protein